MRRAVRRRRPHLLLACVAAGLAAAPASPIVTVVLGATLAAIAGWTLGPRATIVAAGLVLAAGWVGVARLDAIDRPAHAAPPGTVIEAEATALERPRRGSFGSTAPLAIDTGRARGLRVLARMPDKRAGPTRIDAGTRIRIRALVRPDGRAEEPGSTRGVSEANAGAPGTPGFGPLPASDADAFDFAAFLRSRGIGREVRVLSMRVTGQRRGLSGLVDAIRRRAEDGIGAGLPAERAALARGMVLGQDGDVSESTREDFRRAGLAHLLAASGQNVALLCALVLPLLMLAGTSPRTRVAVLLPLVALYVAAAGAGASVARAGVMAAAALLALGLGRPASAAYALLLAAVATLGLNPRATGDPGWQLSFSAVAGILAVGPLLRPALKPLPRPLAEGIAATAAATVATGPLLAHHFGAVSLVALPANLLALAAVAPVMWLGMTQATVAQLEIAGAPLADLAHATAAVLGAVSGVALSWIDWVARTAADPGWAQTETRISGAATLAAYGAIAIAWLAAARRRQGARPAGLVSRFGARARWCELPRRVRVRIAVAAAAAALTTVLVAAAPPAPPPALSIHFIDVGQGDATLVRDPTGAAILFDGGPPEARVDRKLRRLGVTRLSVVVATHQSRDHQGGLLEVVRRFPVDLFLDGGAGTADPQFARLRRTVDAAAIPRRAAHAGQVIRAGATRIRILWPPRGAASGTDPNEHATVAVVSHAGFDVFLSADAESPALARLPLGRVEAMKVPHHGSEDPGLRSLLERLRPRVAVIEVGRGNRYGHPRRSTLDALRAGPRVYRTDRDGTVELQAGGSQIAIRTHR